MHIKEHLIKTFKKAMHKLYQRDGGKNVNGKRNVEDYVLNIVEH